MAKVEFINNSSAESKLVHLFPKAPMTLNENAHNFWHQFTLSFFKAGTMKKWRELAALAFKGLCKEFKKVQELLHGVILCEFFTPYTRSK